MRKEVAFTGKIINFEMQLRIRMRTSIDDIHHWNRQSICRNTTNISTMAILIHLQLAATARETPKIAFAPKLDLLAVPSK
jgi:hypothetical protein